MSQNIGKTLVTIGIILVIIGVVVQFAGKILPFGHLPGDFSWHGKNWSVHFPLASSILISIILTVLANLFFRK